MKAALDFLAMGGYAIFVWPAYGVAALVLGGLSLQTLRGYRRNRRLLDRLQQGGPRRGGAA
jgi:heme exporter protein D